MNYGLPLTYEGALEVELPMENPFWEIDIEVELISPTGRVRTVAAFWDGGSIWRFRMTDDETGDWSYQARIKEGSLKSAELSPRIGGAGVFSLRPYDGDNPLYRHGNTRVSSDGFSFVHEDGTPFFWMGDTAWNEVDPIVKTLMRSFLSYVLPLIWCIGHVADLQCRLILAALMARTTPAHRDHFRPDSPVRLLLHRRVPSKGLRSRGEAFTLVLRHVDAVAWTGGIRLARTATPLPC